MMRLAQEKLCSALVKTEQLKQGDMSRLAHAVAHITQAAISLQKWNDKSNKGAGANRPATSAKGRGGLSPETSQALRNALLGIAPFNPEEVNRQKAQAKDPDCYGYPVAPLSEQVLEAETSGAPTALPSEIKSPGSNDPERLE
jgi:Protein of unknown function (DUF3486)